MKGLNNELKRKLMLTAHLRKIILSIIIFQGLFLTSYYTLANQNTKLPNGPSPRYVILKDGRCYRVGSPVPIPSLGAGDYVVDYHPYRNKQGNNECSCIGDPVPELGDDVYVADYPSYSNNCRIDTVAELSDDRGKGNKQLEAFIFEWFTVAFIVTIIIAIMSIPISLLWRFKFKISACLFAIMTVLSVIAVFIIKIIFELH
ncbi:hypothetical protein [Bartonella harrusi]|uniref:Uncharacterized protein n=1 Tax=Bartonella harrusi TaxID=2961895 RepID=A0ABY5ESR8_9HYPH|nr:hypothetical protein [Bartonella harrusi]UTO28444.1 hypothetical protein NMK50_10060 [Bartonella harrusi]